MDIKQSRIYKLREYMIIVLNELVSDTNYQLNADFLDKDINNYSLDKITVEDTTEKWIIKSSICRDVYDFRSRNAYGSDVMDNLTNIGFFEALERKIKVNNNNKILPEIKGIQEIKCLNCGALSIADTQTAEFAVQIQIKYREEV